MESDPIRAVRRSNRVLSLPPAVSDGSSRQPAGSTRGVFQSGRVCPREKSRQRRHDALVALTQKCGQNVFADPLAPQVVAAIAARVRGGVEVDPMVLSPAGNPVPAVADSLTAEAKAPLQTVEVDASSGVEVDLHFVRHNYSQSRRKNTQVQAVIHQRMRGRSR